MLSNKSLLLRKHRWLAVSLSLSAFVAIGSSYAIIEAQEISSSYVVQSGDTLYSIANRHGISLADLRAWNNLASDIILPGTSLLINQPANSEASSSDNQETDFETPEEPIDTTDDELPNYNTELDNTPASASGTYYTVKSGDFVNRIASMHGISANQLRTWNNLSSDLIHPGDRLIVSQSSSVPTSPAQPETGNNQGEKPNNTSNTTHTVRSGDYLYSIAKRYGVTVDNLISWNNLSSNYIYSGDVLYVQQPESNVTQPEAPENNQETPADNNNESSSSIYVVKPGDFINRIASMHGITANQLRTWNNLSSNLIHPGDRLIVAKQSTPVPETPPAEENDQSADDNNDNQETTKTYTVKAGDYLYKIASEFGITVNNLVDWNNLSSNYIYVGNVLNVTKPNAGSTTPDDSSNQEDKEDDQSEETVKPAQYHTVRAGEFINKIAGDYGITAEQLRSWNNLNSNLIHPGDRLIVTKPAASQDDEAEEETPIKPTEPAPTPAAKTYTVKPGDYLYKIASAHGITVQNIIDWNNLSSNYLYSGDVLFVTKPSSGSTPAPDGNHSSMPDLNAVTPVSVNYDVKLNGLYQSFRKTRSNLGQVYNIVDYFGQKFSAINEYYAGGQTYVELMDSNGQIFGYVPKSAAVVVPQGVHTVYLDAGHGGWETGATNNGVYEKDLNLNITNQLADRLRNLGYHVYESRTNDTAIQLHQRQNEPNALMPDAYISIHHNAMPIPGTAHGIVTLYHDPSIDERNYETMDHHYGTDIIPEGRRLSAEIQNALISATGANNQGIRPQNLHVTRTTDMPATLVELGFMDHTAEFKKLTTQDYQQKLISGLVNGINAYFGKTK